MPIVDDFELVSVEAFDGGDGSEPLRGLGEPYCATWVRGGTTVTICVALVNRLWSLRSLTIEGDETASTLRLMQWSLTKIMNHSVRAGVGYRPEEVIAAPWDKV